MSYTKMLKKNKNKCFVFIILLSCKLRGGKKGLKFKREGNSGQYNFKCKGGSLCGAQSTGNGARQPTVKFHSNNEEEYFH